MIKALRKHPLLVGFVVAAITALGLLLAAAPSAQSQQAATDCSAFFDPPEIFV